MLKRGKLYSASIPVFTALRIFAIWNRNIALFLVVLLVGMIPVVTDIVSTPFLRLTSASLIIAKFIAARSTVAYVGEPLNSCQQSLTISEGIYDKWVWFPGNLLLQY